MISNGNSPPACVLHYYQTNRFLHHSFFHHLLCHSQLLFPRYFYSLSYIHAHAYHNQDQQQHHYQRQPAFRLLSSTTRPGQQPRHKKLQDSRIVVKERRSLSFSLREKAHLFFAIVAFCFGNGNAHNISSVLTAYIHTCTQKKTPQMHNRCFVIAHTCFLQYIIYAQSNTLKNIYLYGATPTSIYIHIHSSIQFFLVGVGILYWIVKWKERKNSILVLLLNAKNKMYMHT